MRNDIKRTILALLLLCVLVTGVAAQPVPASPIIAYGKLHRAFASVCEHPYTYEFLLYHLSDECGHELFLAGDLKPDMVGRTVWVEGTLIDTPTCLIVDVETLETCAPSISKIEGY